MALKKSLRPKIRKNWHIYASPIWRHKAILKKGQYQFRAHVGQNGISHRKCEGDLKTPAGGFKLIGFYHRADRRKYAFVKGLRSKPVRRQNGWCDDKNHRRYNQPIKLPTDIGHERLYREDGLYDIIGVFDANIKPSIKGRGSAIFLHVMRQGEGRDQDAIAGTAGCLSLPLPILRFVLGRISSKTKFIFHV